MKTKLLASAKASSCLAAAFSFCVVLSAGCFSSPTAPNVATLKCQANQDCPIGYECRAKGQPGGCCKPGALVCPVVLVDAASFDLSVSELPNANIDGSGVFADAFAGIDAPASVLDLVGSGGVGGSTSSVGPDSASAGGTHGTGGTNATGGIATLDGASASGGVGGTTTPTLDSGQPDVPLPTPDGAPSDAACTVTPGTCCSAVDCTAAATFKACATACIAADKCCTNSDCAATPSTPQCSAGTCVGGSLSISPSVQGFGSITVGQESALFTFTVANNGTGSTGVPSATISTGATDFQVVSTACSSTLSVNASCTVAVKFAPSVSGDRTGTLQASATPGGQVTASLTGKGLTPASLTLAPASHNFGTATDGTTGAAFAFTVTNTGESLAGATAGLAGQIAGDNPGDFLQTSASTCGSTLAAKATCLITVAFNPPVGAIAARSATLIVSAGPGGSTASVALIGTALECATSANCTTAAKPICLQNTCVSCPNASNSNDHYGDPGSTACTAKSASTPYCMSTGECVPCNGTIGVSSQNWTGCDVFSNTPVCSAANMCVSCASAASPLTPNSACGTIFANYTYPAEGCDLSTGKCVSCLAGSYCTTIVTDSLGGQRDSYGTCNTDGTTCNAQTCPISTCASITQSSCNANYYCCYGYCVATP
jgi:hypothetical protein